MSSSWIHPTEDPEHHQRLVTRLAKYGMELRPREWMTVRGDCMFDALADQLFLSEGQNLDWDDWRYVRTGESFKLRKRIAAWLYYNGNLRIRRVNISIEDAERMLADPKFRPHRDAESKSQHDEAKEVKGDETRENCEVVDSHSSSRHPPEQEPPSEADPNDSQAKPSASHSEPTEQGAKLSDFYIPGNRHSTWDEYCRLLNSTAAPREEGDHLALIAASNVLQRNIIVVSSAPGEAPTNYITAFSPFDDNDIQVADQHPPLYLVHWFPVHYDSAVRRSSSDGNSTCGVA